MQKVIDFIYGEMKETSTSYSKYFIIKYQFNRTNLPKDIKLLEWLLCNDLSTYKEKMEEVGILTENLKNLQCFLVLRTLVSLAAYSKYYPEYEFSELFQCGIVGDTQADKVYDLAKEVLQDFEVLIERTTYNSPLVACFSGLVESLGKNIDSKESEVTIPFGDFEQDSFWEFEDTWARKIKGVGTEKIQDPFSGLIFFDKIEEIVQPDVEELEEISEPSLPIPEIRVSKSRDTPVRPGRLQSKLFKKEEILPMDFLKKLADEVITEQSIEGGI